jgi:hypothetical protein
MGDLSDDFCNKFKEYLLRANLDIPHKQTPFDRCKLTPHFELLFLS